MKIFYFALSCGLVGCAIPANEPSFVTEKTPAVSAIAGESRPDDPLSEQIRAANEKNNNRLLKGDWRAAKPAVGPNP